MSSPLKIKARRRSSTERSRSPDLWAYAWTLALWQQRKWNIYKQVQGRSEDTSLVTSLAEATTRQPLGRACALWAVARLCPKWSRSPDLFRRNTRRHWLWDYWWKIYTWMEENEIWEHFSWLGWGQHSTQKKKVLASLSVDVQEYSI